MGTDGRREQIELGSRAGKSTSCQRRLECERTLVKEVDGALHVENIPEPTPPEPVARPVEMWSNGERVSKWDE